MSYLFLKFFTSAALIVAISEISKRYSLIAALLASLPLTSLLAFVWLYIDTKDTRKVITLSYDVAWLVLPSLAFFVVLPAALKQGMSFWLALIIAAVATALAYGLTVWVLQQVR